MSHAEQVTPKRLKAHFSSEMLKRVKDIFPELPLLVSTEKFRASMGLAPSAPTDTKPYSQPPGRVAVLQGCGLHLLVFGMRGVRSRGS